MDGTKPRLVIGALSKRTGCNVETIRYYERIGLLPPPARSPSGYRLYSLDHLKRLAFVRRARDLGFTLDEVRTLLALADRQKRSCGEARAVGLHHLDDVRAKIADLKAIERVLAEMVARCADGKLPDCPLIEALFWPGISWQRPEAGLSSGLPCRGGTEPGEETSR